MKEASREVIERINIGPNKVCIREDLAKKNMMFSQESCPSIIEMGSVELIELKKSRMQCLSCGHFASEGRIICACGKFIRLNQEMMERVRKDFDNLKTPFFRASPREVPTMDQTCGNKHHHKGKDAL